MSNLQIRIEQLRRVGVVVNHEYEYRGSQKNRHRVDLEDTVSSIILPFIPLEWCAICMCESELYIGPCCGNTGAVQDVINGSFRNSGDLSANELAFIGPLLRSHDGWEIYAGEFDIDKALQPARWRVGDQIVQNYSESQEIPATLDPWEKICVIHAALEDVLALAEDEVPYEPRKEELKGQQVINTLHDTLEAIRWSDVCSPNTSGEHFENQKPEYKQKAFDEKDSHIMQRKIALMRLIEPARELVDTLEDMLQNDPPLQGYALVSSGTDNLLKTHLGLCIYANKEAVDRVIKGWAKHETPESSRGRHGEGIHVPTYIEPSGLADIVPISVSIQNGLEIQR